MAEYRCATLPSHIAAGGRAGPGRAPGARAPRRGAAVEVDAELRGEAEFRLVVVAHLGAGDAAAGDGGLHRVQVHPLGLLVVGGVLAYVTCSPHVAETLVQVQDLLRANARHVADWVERGAAIYVCGSLQGMAGGVHEALVEILGEETLDALTADARYRRDVY